MNVFTLGGEGEHAKAMSLGAIPTLSGLVKVMITSGPRIASPFSNKSI